MCYERESLQKKKKKKKKSLACRRRDQRQVFFPAVFVLRVTLSLRQRKRLQLC